MACSFRPTPSEVAAAEVIKSKLPEHAIIALVRSPIRGSEYHWVDLVSNRSGVATFDGEGRWSRRSGDLLSEEDPTPPKGAVLLRVVIA